MSGTVTCSEPQVQHEHMHACIQGPERQPCHPNSDKMALFSSTFSIILSQSTPSPFSFEEELSSFLMSPRAAQTMSITGFAASSYVTNDS